MTNEVLSKLKFELDYEERDKITEILEYILANWAPGSKIYSKNNLELSVSLTGRSAMGYSTSFQGLHYSFILLYTIPKYFNQYCWTDLDNIPGMVEFWYGVYKQALESEETSEEIPKEKEHASSGI